MKIVGAGCVAAGDSMNRTLPTVGMVALLVAVAITSALAAANPLRICGDPDNLPFSNQKLEGFENKIADVIAAELGTTPSYFWWPHQRGLVRNTFDADKCDVVIGIPKGYDLVLWTKPYYRTAYVIAYRNDKGYRITSMDDPALKTLRIGAFMNTPPQEALAVRGIVESVSAGYSLFFDVQGDGEERPARLLADLLAGTIDVALPWGPQAGYFAKKLHAPLELVPLESEPNVPLAFDISMGVKKGNQALKIELEKAIDRRQTEIRAILEDYGVPLMPAHQAPAGASGQQNGGDAPSGGDAQGQGASSAPAKNPFKAADVQAVAQGKALFLENACSGCHGAGGGGGMGPSLIDDEWKFGSKDDVLYRQVKGEIAEATMPKVYSTLSDDEVWKMLAYVRSLYAGDPTKIDW